MRSSLFVLAVALCLLSVACGSDRPATGQTDATTEFFTNQFGDHCTKIIVPSGKVGLPDAVALSCVPAGAQR